MIDLEEAPGYAYEKGVVYNKKTGRPLKPVVTTSGYPVVRPYCNGRYVNLSMHKVVAKYELGEVGEVVEHKDDNKLNYSPDNLMASTQRANITKALARPVVATHIATGVETWFVSAAEAARHIRCEGSKITSICRKRKGYKSVKGYTFRYADEVVTNGIPEDGQCD